MAKGSFWKGSPKQKVNTDSEEDIKKKKKTGERNLYASTSQTSKASHMMSRMLRKQAIQLRDCVYICVSVKDKFISTSVQEDEGVEEK